MNNLQEISNLIDSLAKQKGLTVSEVLKNCELNKDTVYNMKRGQMPSADKMLVLAQYLDVSVEYLMGVTDDPTMPKRKEWSGKRS